MINFRVWDKLRDFYFSQDAKSLATPDRDRVLRAEIRGRELELLHGYVIEYRREMESPVPDVTLRTNFRRNIWKQLDVIAGLK